MSGAGVNVRWTREQIAAVMETIRDLDPKRVGGAMKVMKQLERAERHFARGETGRVSLWFGTAPLSLLGSVLPKSDSPHCAAALESLRAAALATQKAAKKAARTSPAQRTPSLHNPLSETRDKRVRHITGSPRRER